MIKENLKKDPQPFCEESFAGGWCVKLFNAQVGGDGLNSLTTSYVVAVVQNPGLGLKEESAHAYYSASGTDFELGNDFNRFKRPLELTYEGGIVTLNMETDTNNQNIQFNFNS